MAKTVGDYSDAVRRIVSADVDPASTSHGDVLDDLRASEGPQVTEDVARDLAEKVLTEERVLEAIESTGELPTRDELGPITSVSDDYGMDDRQDAVLDAISDRVATTEDVSRAVRSNQPTTRAEANEAIRGMGKEIRGATAGDVVDDVVTVEDVVGSSGTDPGRGEVFRSDVEDVTRDLSAGSEIGDSPDRLEAVADEASQEIGAPTRNAFERARYQAVAQADTVTPAEVIDGTTSKTPVQVIRDNSGDAIVATGGPGGETSERVAEEIGVEYQGTEEIVDSMGLEQQRGEAHMTIDGRRFSEVDVS